MSSGDLPWPDIPLPSLLCGRGTAGRGPCGPQGLAATPQERMPCTNSAELRPGGAQLLLPPHFPLTGALKPLTVVCQTPIICDPQIPVLVPRFHEKEGLEEAATLG